MQNNDQRGSLSDKFRDFGATPSDGLWSVIEEQLDEKKKRRFPFWWWTTGLAACFLTVLLIREMELEKNTQLPEKRAQEKTSNATSQTSGIPSASLQHNTQFHPDFTVTFDTDRLLKWFGNHPDYSSNFCGETPYSYSNSTQLANVTPLTPADSSSAPGSVTDSVDYHDSSVLYAMEKSNSCDYFVPVKPGRWTIGCAAGYSERIGPEPVSETANTDEMDILSLVPPPVSNPAENKTLEQQWFAEISVSRILTRRISLQTGIEGAYFSTGNLQSSSPAVSGKATGMSIGIPLYVNYSLINRGRLEWYAGTGIQHTFAFSKTVETTTTYPNSVITTSETVHPQGQLTSGQLHTGIRFRFYRSASLEVKPLVRYYFSEKLANTETFLGKRFWIGGTAGIVWRF